MAKPTQSIFPIENGKLTTDLDANNLRLLNLDTSNLPGGSGNDTGTTTAILKGDGDHGFADAVADVDYASVGSVAGLETSAAHDADMTTLTGLISVNTDAITNLTIEVNNKADTTDVATALGLKEDITDHDADIVSVNTAIADVATDLTALTTEVGNKADSASVSTALAAKENLLPTTASDGFVLVRDADNTWRFVDPVTLGSTNATYTDGITHSSTTFNSTLAVFTANDVGLTIVAPGDIPADTTIATFVNATTVTLSAAATTTASSVNFTILNRFLPSGGSGTVSSVGVNNNITDLLTTSVANASTTPVITIGGATAVAANRFYGNFTAFTGTAGFGTAAVARASLGGTTVGQAIFQLTNPSAVGYVRVNADNSVTFRSTASTLGDLGAESALTFSAPLARSTNTISMPAAVSVPGQVSGYLTGADHATFSAKANSSVTITTTAPLTIGGVSGGNANLTANRTIAMPASTGNADGTSQVDGYLTGADHTLFANKPPNSRSISTTAPLTIAGVSGGTADLSANRTIAIPKATALVDGYLAATDFGAFLAGSPHTDLVGNVTAWTVTAPTTRVVLTQTLTGALAISLPHPNTYPHTSTQGFIEFVDVATTPAMTNVGITLVPLGGTTVDGSASPFTLPRGTQYLRINSNGVTRWTTTRYYVQNLANPTNIAGTATFITTGLTAARTIAVPDANSTLIVPTDPAAASGSVVSSISATGVATQTLLSPANLAYNPFPVGTVGVTISSPQAMPNLTTNTYDSVSIIGNVPAGGLTLKLPDAQRLDAGQTITVRDFSGTVNSTHVVTITSGTGTDAFDGTPSGSVTFDETYGSKTFASDGNGAWSVPSAKAVTVKPFQNIQPQGNVYTLQVDSTAAGSQNGHMVLGNGANVLVVAPAPFDGMKMELVVKQPPSGAAGTLVLPSVSMTPGGGAGLLALTATNGAIDRIKCIYDGIQGAYMWNGLIANLTGATLPTAPSNLTAGTVTSSTIPMTWTAGTGQSTYDLQRSTDNVSFVNIANPAGSDTGYTDVGLSASTTYYYKIRGHNSAGDSSFSSTLTSATISGCSTVDGVIGRPSDNTWQPTGSVITIGSSTGQKAVALNNFIPSATNLSPCKISIPIFKTNNPTGDLTCYLWSSSGTSPTNTPNARIYTSTTIPLASIVNTTEADALGTSGLPGTGPLSFTFTGVTLTNGLQYFVAVGCSSLPAANLSSNCFKWVCTAGQTSTWLTYKTTGSGDTGSTWVAFTASTNNRCFIKTYK